MSFTRIVAGLLGQQVPWHEQAVLFEADRPLPARATPRKWRWPSLGRWLSAALPWTRSHDLARRGWSGESEAKLASLVNATDDAIIIWSLDGKITSWNPGAERMYGYSAEEAL